MNPRLSSNTAFNEAGKPVGQIIKNKAYSLLPYQTCFDSSLLRKIADDLDALNEHQETDSHEAGSGCVGRCDYTLELDPEQQW